MLRVECYGGGANEPPLGGSRANCSVGPSCGNRAMQGRTEPKLTLVPTPGKGWGIVAGERVAGAFVTEYVGEIIDEATECGSGRRAYRRRGRIPIRPDRRRVRNRDETK